MANIIDRRESYNKKRNVSNRQRYIERVKDQVKDAVNQSVAKGKIKDLAKGDKVKVKVRDTKEPSIQQDYSSGEHDYVVPGNRDFESGDKIKKPDSDGRGKGKGGSLGEDSEDDFTFVLTKDEYLDVLFEDLELPDLVKKSLKSTKTLNYERRGYSTTGNPSNMDITKTYLRSIGRRIALKRPKTKQIKELEKRLEITSKWAKKFQKAFDDFEPADNVSQESNELLKQSYQAQAEELEQEHKQIKQDLEELSKKQKNIPYFDPLDVRYRRYEKVPKPISHAVMFCLMDVSGSMGEREKDIAKRFFLLLYLFLTRKYEKVDIRFIRHTTEAQEVDENTFFYDKLSGGTKISSALNLADQIIKDDYDLGSTNVYIAQASDGDNWEDDNGICVDVIKHLLKKVQYYAYIEISSDLSSPFLDLYSHGIWNDFEQLSEQYKNLQCRVIKDKREIFPVFADLFKKKGESK